MIMNDQLTNYICQTDGECGCECIKNTIEKYDAFIKNFFSCNGSATGIRNIYSILRDDPMMREKKICTIDLNRSYNIYSEYHDGMKAFISEIIETISTNRFNNIETDIDTFVEKLKKAQECDKDFILSLFNGENNREEESDVCDALKNIEFLIDFIPQMHKMKESCIELQDMSLGCGLDKSSPACKLINDSLYLLYSSISEYCYKCIVEVVSIYTKIYDIICGDNKVEESTVYRLF